MQDPELAQVRVNKEPGGISNLSCVCAGAAQPCPWWGCTCAKVGALNRRAFPSACKGTSAGLPQQYCGTCINTLQTCLVQWCDQSKCSSGISSASHPNTASPPPAPTSHRTAAPGRPIARDPNTGGHGFSIASPRPFPHPTGPKRSYFSAVGFTPKYCLSPPSPPPHTAPPLLAWPADRARPRYRRARFQHRIASAMHSSYRPQHFIFSWYGLHRAEAFH